MLLSNPWRHKCDPLEDEIRWAPQLKSIATMGRPVASGQRPTNRIFDVHGLNSAINVAALENNQIWNVLKHLKH